jgi:Heparinase II/III-like protein/Heparinase II/III N-terminus
MIGRLRGRSTTELRDRLVQYVRVVAERRGIMQHVVVPDDIELIPRSPWPALDAVAIAHRLAPSAHDALIARADRVVAGTFDVLGRQGLSYGSPVNWQRDPLAGREAALQHWSRVPYLDHDRVGDHKIIWELNRHQWLFALGQAWRLTGDPRYPETAVRLLREWLDANPPKRGINWCSALEMAFRVQSWIHGLRLLDGAPAFSPSLRRDVVASAALQIDHVSWNLSTWFSPNTHLTGEALAMLSAGCAWPALPNASRWRAQGWKILCDQAPRQLRPDGVYFEQSSWYQAYTLDFYSLGVVWARLAGLPIPAGLAERIRAAAIALRSVTRPDGTIARLGDDDGGRTLPLSTAAQGDMTDTLWRAAVLLGDSDALPSDSPGRDALLWLEGPAAYDSTASPGRDDPARRSRALRDGGWITLVEPAESAARDHWLIFDVGPHGALTHAHAHADALGFDLSVHGVPMIVDPGTGSYVGPQRRMYRSTAAHNTVTVDRADSSEQGTSFNWRSATDSVLHGFGSVAAVGSFASASHDGYARLADPVRHHRTILRLHRHYWLMFDTLDAAASHHASLTLQGAPDVHIVQHTPHRFAMSVTRPAREITLYVAVDARLGARIDHRTVSPAYALELPAAAVVADGTVHGHVTVCTAIGAADEGAPEKVEQCGMEPVWRITHRHGDDLVACPAGRDVTIGPARFDGVALAMLGGDAPHTLVAAGAGTLHLAGTSYSLGHDDLRVARRALNGTWTMES